MKLILKTDGGSRGNPGPAAYGFVVYHVQDDFSPSENNGMKNNAVKILEKRGNYLGITTNNQAEYAGLIAGLKWVLANTTCTKLDIYLDSLLVVNQVKGLYKVKNPDLYPKWQEARELLKKINKWSINHTYRSENSLADNLVNQALDNRQ